MTSERHDFSAADYKQVIDDIRCAGLSVQNQDYCLLFMWPEPIPMQSDIRPNNLECAIIVTRLMLQVLDPEVREKDLVGEARARLAATCQPEPLSDQVENSLEFAKAMLEYAWHHLPVLTPKSDPQVIRDVAYRQEKLIRTLQERGLSPDFRIYMNTLQHVLWNQDQFTLHRECNLVVDVETNVARLESTLTADNKPKWQQAPEIWDRSKLDFPAFLEKRFGDKLSPDGLTRTRNVFNRVDVIRITAINKDMTIDDIPRRFKVNLAMEGRNKRGQKVVAKHITSYFLRVAVGQSKDLASDNNTRAAVLYAFNAAGTSIDPPYQVHLDKAYSPNAGQSTEGRPHNVKTAPYIGNINLNEERRKTPRRRFYLYYVLEPACLLDQDCMPGPICGPDVITDLGDPDNIASFGNPSLNFHPSVAVPALATLVDPSDGTTTDTLFEDDETLVSEDGEIAE